MVIANGMRVEKAKVEASTFSENVLVQVGNKQALSIHGSPPQLLQFVLSTKTCRI